MGQALWKTVILLYNVYLSYELTVLPLGGYPREMKTHPQKRLV